MAAKDFFGDFSGDFSAEADKQINLTTADSSGSSLSSTFSGFSCSSRASNIELLKIFAVFLIILFHMVQTLTEKSDVLLSSGSSTGRILNLESCVSEYRGVSFILYLFSRSGLLGNALFFVCSSWFLTYSCKSYGKKAALLIAKVWIVSVTMLLVFTFNTVDGNAAVTIERPVILRCLLPSVFSNNWYITKYILFLCIVPLLNIVLDNLSKGKHALFIAFVIVTKVLIDPFTIEWSSSMLCDDLWQWIIVFFIIAYIKKYLPTFRRNIPGNLFLLIAGLLIYFSEAACKVFTGFSAAEESSLFAGILNLLLIGWEKNGFYIYLIAIALFHLFHRMKFHCNLINRISRYSLLIYLTHENLLIRTYYRPQLFLNIFERTGFEHTVGILVFLAVSTFIISLLVSVILDRTVCRLAGYLVDKYWLRIRLFARSMLR